MSEALPDVPTVIGECMGYVMLRKNGECILYAPDGEVVTRSPLHDDPAYYTILGHIFGTLAALHKTKKDN